MQTLYSFKGKPAFLAEINYPQFSLQIITKRCV